MTVRVFIVDDHPLLRRGLAQLIEMAGDRGLAMAGEASNGAEALARIESLNPELVVLDLNMPDMNGVEVLQALRERGFSAPVVFLTVSDEQTDFSAALQSGANGYLLKQSEPDRLVDDLLRAASGEVVISPLLTSALARAMRSAGRSGPEGLEGVTPREQDILGCLGRGLSNKRIARELDITEATAKVHVRSLLRKMKLRSRVEAAVWAARHGMVPDEPD